MLGPDKQIVSANHTVTSAGATPQLQRMQHLTGTNDEVEVSEEKKEKGGRGRRNLHIHASVIVHVSRCDFCCPTGGSAR